MAGEQDDFRRADGPEPHRDRTKAILRDYPEIRTLIGRNPWSLGLILGVVTTQIALGWVLASRPWWVMIAVAWLVGAFLSHSLYVLIQLWALPQLRIPSGPAICVTTPATQLGSTATVLFFPAVTAPCCCIHCCT